VRDEDAFETGRRLCREDGLRVGISSRAVAWACRQLGQRAKRAGRMIVGMPASHEERYLPTALYEEVPPARVS